MACGGGSSTVATPAPAPVAATPAPVAATPAPAATAPTPVAPAPVTATPAPVAATPAPAPVAAGPVPSPSGTPTASLASTQTEASSLAAEVKAGYANAASASAGAGFKTPFGVETAALPQGVSATISCSLFASGGSGSITYDISGTAITTGTAISYTYNACSYSGYTFNGAVNIVYDRYVSPSDFAFTISYTNFTASGPGVASQSVSGKSSCSVAAGVSSCYYNDGTRGWSSTMSYSASGTVNGSYAVNYGNGSVQVTYANFGATGGTATITGANGSKAVVTRNSATSFTVTITPSGGGASSSYTVTL
jgi:hypothetical protein